MNDASSVESIFHTALAYAELLRMLKEDEPPRPSMRLSRSGEALATISAQRRTEPAQLAKLVRGELDWIVIAGQDQVAKIWETVTGKEVCAFGKTAAGSSAMSVLPAKRFRELPMAPSVAISPDGTWAVSTVQEATDTELRAAPAKASDKSRASTLILWDARTGKERRRLHWDRDMDDRVAISPDGRRIACANTRGARSGMQRPAKSWCDYTESPARYASCSVRTAVCW